MGGWVGWDFLWGGGGDARQPRLGDPYYCRRGPARGVGRLSRQLNGAADGEPQREPRREAAHEAEEAQRGGERGRGDLSAVAADVQAAGGAAAAGPQGLPLPRGAVEPRARLRHVPPEDGLVAPGGLGVVEGLEYGGAHALAELRNAERGGAVERRDGLPLLLEEQRRPGGEEAIAIVVDDGPL